jgi:hypothetical protein
LIEDELLDLSDEDRHEQRQLRSRPLLDDFKAWLDQQLETLTPRHELRGAIEYMTKRWECFERFLESGAIPIHNNATEQAIKTNATQWEGKVRLFDRKTPGKSGDLCSFTGHDLARSVGSRRKFMSDAAKPELPPFCLKA